MKFVPSNRDDIIRYFRGTYIKLKERGDELFFIENVDSLRVTGKHETGEQFVLYMDETTPYTVEYVLPHKSFFQNGNDAVLLERLPQKQYQRGLSEANTGLKYMTSAGQVKPVGLSFGILKKFVSKQPFYTLLKAINHPTAITCVLNSRMMYHKAKKEIYIDFLPVAKVNAAKLTVTMIKPIFMEEINEFLKHSGESNTFKVEIYSPPPHREKTKPAELVKQMQVEVHDDNL